MYCTKMYLHEHNPTGVTLYPDSLGGSEEGEGSELRHITKEYIRKMVRTLSVNYPVLRQNKRVLFNTFVKDHCLKSHHCTLIQEARRDR